MYILYFKHVSRTSELKNQTNIQTQLPIFYNDNFNNFVS